MEKIAPSSSWNEQPTPAQVRAITRLCMALHIREPLEETPSNRREARDMIYQLRAKLRGGVNDKNRT